MAWTGIPHRLLMQVTREDLDLVGATVWVQGRQKGHGTVGRMLPLCPPAVDAFRAFDRHEAYGTFSTSAARQAWLRALRRCNFALTSRPYDLRHSWGTLVYQLTGDLPATQALLGHADPRTTLRYTVAGVAPRMLEAMRTVGPVVSGVQHPVPNPAADPVTPMKPEEI